MRGVRGATTVTKNESEEIISQTKNLVEEMVTANQIKPQDITHVLISVTSELNADFPAKALRLMDGWRYVPVMCMQEIEVAGSLEKCIRVMMTVNTEKDQKSIEHIYQREAVKLRPDLRSKEGADN